MLARSREVSNIKSLIYLNSISNHLCLTSPFGSVRGGLLMLAYGILIALSQASALSWFTYIEISIETVPTQSNAPRPHRTDSGGEGVGATPQGRSYQSPANGQLMYPP
jgi:hypothetical protein